MLKIIHLTDIHIVPLRDRIFGLDPRKRLMRCIKSINQHHANADLCVITGDLTNTGDTSSYELLRNCLKGLRVPVRLLIGNHDNRACFRSIFPDTPLDSHGFVQSVLDMDGARLLFLDTLEEKSPGSGLLCKNRLQWLEEKLQEANEGRAYVFMHHPPKSVHVPYFEQILLQEGGSFFDLLRTFPCVRHVTFGHLHLNITGAWSGVSFSCNRGTVYRIELALDDDQAKYLQAEPSYSVLLIDEQETVVHYVDSADSHEPLAVEYPQLEGGPERIELLAAATNVVIE